MSQQKKQPYTGWITKRIRQDGWLEHQIKTNAELIAEDYLWGYIDGNLLPDNALYEPAKSTLQKIERNWRTKQSRQGKKVITISAESQRRIEKYRKKTGKTAIEIIDELTARLESSPNQGASFSPLAISAKPQEEEQSDHYSVDNTHDPDKELI